MYRAQIVLLKLRNEQLLLQIKKLVRQLKAIRDEMYVIRAESCALIMKAKQAGGGVKRGNYAYHKGRCEVAQQVIKLLKGV
jgi:vacuolar-type H+-ATPase subunit D/Vma8